MPRATTVLCAILLAQAAGDRQEDAQALARWRLSRVEPAAARPEHSSSADELLDVAARFEAVGRLGEARARVRAIQDLFPSHPAPAIALLRLDSGRCRGSPCASCARCAAASARLLLKSVRACSSDMPLAARTRSSKRNARHCACWRLPVAVGLQRRAAGLPCERGSGGRTASRICGRGDARRR